jgi:hypothetical protein
MSYILGALAVYKLLQIFDSLTPREAMPWVKVLIGTVLGYGAAFVVNSPDKWTGGLVIATLAGACHGILRLITVLGDLAVRRTIK